MRRVGLPGLVLDLFSPGMTLGSSTYCICARSTSCTAAAEFRLKQREAVKAKKAKVAKMLADIYGVCCTYMVLSLLLCRWPFLGLYAQIYKKHRW